MKIVKLILFVPPLLSCGLALSSATQAKDYWLKMERKGTSFGYRHMAIRKTNGGCFEYQFEQKYKTDVAGLNPQEITLSGIFIVDPKLRPISFDFLVQSPAKEVRSSGRYANGRMKLTVTEGKDVREMELAFEDTFFDVVLGDLILKRKGERIFNLKIYNAYDMVVESIQVAVTRSDKNTIEATVKDSLTISLDRQGTITEMRLEKLDIRFYHTSAADAQNISYLHTADDLSWIVKSQSLIPSVYDVVQARVQVRWENVPLDDFDLEDNRQKVMRKISGQDEQEVILEFVQATLVSKGIKVPITDRRLSPYLHETGYIQSGDSAIKQQLTQIKGDEQDAFAITQNILRWIVANIQRDYLAETLTGPETLKYKRGKCSEFAILFASLARAAGIPTKIVFGETYVGNQWIGHWWNEVWLGEWLAVDPSSGTFISGPSHIKFAGSASEADLFNFSFKPVKNLTIEIMDLKEQNPPVTDGLKTGIVGRTYFNSDFACKIAAPDDTWVIMEKAEGTNISVTMKPKGEEDVVFALVLFAVPAGMPAKTILDGRLNALSGMVKEFKKLEEGEVEIAGKRAPKVVFQQAGKDEQLLINENSLLVAGSNAYLFVFFAPAPRVDEFKVVAKRIIDSFDITKK